MNTAVIIVTYNSAATIAPCLAGVLASRQAGDELVVVDNASRDGTPSLVNRLADTLPPGQLTVITNTTNRGFSAAVNQGIRASHAPLVALLNPDVVVPVGWQQRLAARLDAPEVAAVGPVSNFAAGRQSVACHWPGALPQQMGVQEAAQYLGAQHAGRYEATPLLIGFCMLLRRAVLDQVGGLDERLFLGNDDLELSWRLRLHGYELRIACDCFVYHEGQHSFRTDPGSVTGRLLCESSDALYAILGEHYGSGRVPTPEELWGIDWFTPATPDFNPQIRFHQPLTLPRPQQTPATGSSPLVSIIILTWNQLQYTNACLASIARHTPEPYEIIVVDNGSTDGSVAWLRQQAAGDGRIRLIENTGNRGFAAGCNQGLSVARGEYLLLLNNDVVVTPEWLPGLLACHAADPQAGLVGPLTNNASGIQGMGPQEYGPAGLDRFARQFRQRHRHRRVPSRRLVGFCMLFSRQLYHEIGGLDERFGTGNFEDDDLCLRSAVAGYRNLVAADVYIHHHGGASFAGGGLDYRAAIAGTWTLFKEKWSAPVPDRDQALRIAHCRLLEELQRLLLAEQYRLLLEPLTSAAAPLADNQQVRELLAQAYGALGRHTEALALLPAGSAPALALEGRLALERGDDAQALCRCRAALTADPGCGAPYPVLALLADRRGEADYAAALLLHGIMLDPTAAGYEPLLERLLPRERLPELVALLQEAAQLYPESRRVWRLLARSASLAGRPAAAVRAAEEFCRRFDADEQVLAAGLAARRTIGPHQGEALPGRSVSLCMIVRDEGQQLPACLLSCRPLVQELVVVDTGSADRTPELAELYGARLFRHPWDDDFATARNAGLNRAVGDWILVMDADERLSPRDYPTFTTLLEGALPAGFVMTTRNYTTAALAGLHPLDGAYPEEEAGSGWTASSKVRLFPNRPEIRFTGLVHETVDEAVRAAGLPLQTHPVPIHHYGHLAGDRQQRKQQLYYQLGREKLQRCREPKALYELAVQAGELGRFGEAEELWREFLVLEPERAVAWFNLGYLLLQQGRPVEATAATERALTLQPGHREALSNLGLCRFILLPPAEAMGELERLRLQHPEDTTLALLTAAAQGLTRQTPFKQAAAAPMAFWERLCGILQRQGRGGDAAALQRLVAGVLGTG